MNYYLPANYIIDVTEKRDQIHNAVVWGIEETIKAHGIVTKHTMSSAIKRVESQVVNIAEQEIRRNLMTNFDNPKYSSVMNPNNFSKKIQKMFPKEVERIMNLSCQVTEKIHGENFRYGIVDDQPFLGQRNNICITDEHPHQSKFGKELHRNLKAIHKFCSNQEDDYVFFGELHGNGLQKGFTFDADGYNVLWFEIQKNGDYLNPKESLQLLQELNLPTTPYLGDMTLKEAFDFDIESFSSQVANEDYIEGIVIKPYEIPVEWQWNKRLIVKRKTEKYLEHKKGKSKQVDPFENFESEFADYITEERINHVHDQMREQELPVHYEMKDLKYLIHMTINDIKENENDGEDFGKIEEKYLKKYIPKFYRYYLAERAKETMSV